MKIKEIPIKYIKFDDKIKNIRKEQSEEAIGKYMEKYDSGTSKSILVKEIDRQNFILIDGHHRLEACKRLKRQKVDIEIIDIEDKNIYAKAVECNQEHGVRLTEKEEEYIILELFEQGKTQEEMGKIFHISQQAISKKIENSPILKKQLSSKINISTINEILSGNNQDKVANNYKITQGRVSQIWGDFKNDLIEKFNAGIPKEELIEISNKNKINITKEKINEIIPEESNYLINGDCLKELLKFKDNYIDCIIIDPPYGIEYQSNYKKEKYDKIYGDNKEVFDLLDKSFKLVESKMKTNSHIYIFTSWKVIEKVKPIVEKYFEVKNCLIWNKNNWSMGDLNNNYAEKYEIIIFAVKGKKNLQCEMRPVNVLNYARTNNPEHPTQKPIELLQELIRNSTKKGELILDYFAGSGSTLKAAKEEKRKWIGIEIK